VNAVRTLPDGRSVVSLNHNETSYLYKEIFEDESYLPPGGFQLPARPVVFDIGANIGLFTLFARQRWVDARVFAFEPVPQIFEVLRRNVGGLPDVHLYDVAVGDTAGTRELTYYPRYTMMSGFDTDPVADRALVRSYIGNIAEGMDRERRETLLDAADGFLEGRFDREFVSCAVRPLADLAGTCGVDRIDLLKVDVEGAEVQVLQGIGEALWPALGNAVVEVSDRAGELAAVRRLFEAHGMRILVRQAAQYRGTHLFMVFATRTG
jgi:FkbM family methyltransferase